MVSSDCIEFYSVLICFIFVICSVGFIEISFAPIIFVAKLFGFLFLQLSSFLSCACYLIFTGSNNNQHSSSSTAGNHKPTSSTGSNLGSCLREMFGCFHWMFVCHCSAQIWLRFHRVWTGTLKCFICCAEMAKRKNHSGHNVNHKAHKNGIKRPRTHKYTSLLGVSFVSAKTKEMMRFCFSCRTWRRTRVMRFVCSSSQFNTLQRCRRERPKEETRVAAKARIPTSDAQQRRKMKKKSKLIMI